MSNPLQTLGCDVDSEMRFGDVRDSKTVLPGLT